MSKRNWLLGGTILGIVTCYLVSSCRTIPKKAFAVQPFDIKKYLGHWYEIARFDFRFEKNLNNTSANYTQNANGSIKVVNRGYNFKK